MLTNCFVSTFLFCCCVPIEIILAIFFYPLSKCYVYGEVVMQFVEIKAAARVCKSRYDWFW